MSVIVGVHGIAQQQVGRYLLRAPWSQALADGVERATGARVAPPDLDVAFYGDLFLDSAENGTKGSSIDGLDDQDVEFILAAADEVISDAELVDVEPKGFPALPPALLRVVAAVDRRFGQHAGPLFVGELRQVRRYLTDPVLKAAADARVAAAVDADCRVLIGHSLGSVVALEYVRLHPKREFHTLLTLGSPLGLRAIRHLLPDASFGTGPDGPANVASWRNLRDRHDPVALAGGLSASWPAVRDDDTIDNGREPHAAVRYLAKKQAGAAVIDSAPGAAAPGAAAP